MYERILVISPDSALVGELERVLEAEHCDLTSLATVEEALRPLEDGQFDAVFCDSAVTGIDGFEPLLQLSRRPQPVPILLTFARSSEDSMTQALERGAFGALCQPFDRSEVILALRRIRERASILQTTARAERDLSRCLVDRPIVAASQAMIELLEQLERTAASDAPALLCGELGTGKEGIARVIHEQSPRRKRAFVRVPCAGKSEDELTRELVGVNGSGMLFEANRGTLYLDDVGALPLPLQDELLALLRNESSALSNHADPRAIDVRILASSREALPDLIESGQLREDFYKTLSGITLDIPALRDRREDIPLLVDHLLGHFRRSLDSPVTSLADEALERFANYEWPGNLRELENVIERAVLLAEGERITLEDVPDDIASANPACDAKERDAFSLRRARRRAESHVISRALRATESNRTHAAKLLGISHRALLYKIKEYGLS